jgi:hypothetical protein
VVAAEVAEVEEVAVVEVAVPHLREQVQKVVIHIVQQMI